MKYPALVFLVDPSASAWLKSVLWSALRGDLVDTADDSEVLACVSSAVYDERPKKFTIPSSFIMCRRSTGSTSSRSPPGHRERGSNMPDTTPGSRGRDRQKIPRIEATEAAEIYTRCDRLETSAGDPLAGLRTAGFGWFLARVEESILQLAVQPGSWGERTRARLISEIITNLTGVPAASWSVEDIAQMSNVLIPCFLLELGRRNQHVQVEFPRDPCQCDARFALKTGPSHPARTLTRHQLVHLVTKLGEELVGLCYFGDQQSRAAIEARLALNGTATDPEAGTAN